MKLVGFSVEFDSQVERTNLLLHFLREEVSHSIAILDIGSEALTYFVDRLVEIRSSGVSVR